VIALDIYRSREQDTLGMDTAVVLQAMNHPHAIHIPDRRAAADYLLDRVRPDDVILTLGAGDSDKVGAVGVGRIKKGITDCVRVGCIGDFDVTTISNLGSRLKSGA
jgi:UDP-N-acetylmuramate-alanine ligase